MAPSSVAHLYGPEPARLLGQIRFSHELDCVQIRQSGKDVEDKLSCRRAGLQVVGHLGDTNGVTSRICAVRRDEPLDATLFVAVHLSQRHRPELGLWMRDQISQSP